LRALSRSGEMGGGEMVPYHRRSILSLSAKIPSFLLFILVRGGTLAISPSERTPRESSLACVSLPASLVPTLLI